MLPVKSNTEFDALKKKYAGGIELSGKTIGIIGAGRIGQTVAKMAFGLGMNVIIYDIISRDLSIELDIAGKKISVPLKHKDEIYGILYLEKSTKINSSVHSFKKSRRPVKAP